MVLLAIEATYSREALAIREPGFTRSILLHTQYEGIVDTIVQLFCVTPFWLNQICPAHVLSHLHVIKENGNV